MIKKDVCKWASFFYVLCNVGDQLSSTKVQEIFHIRKEIVLKQAKKIILICNNF